MTIKLVVNYAGSHSCLGTVFEYQQRSKMTVEEAQKHKWVLFIVRVVGAENDDEKAERIDYYAQQYEDLAGAKIERVTFVTEDGIFGPKDLSEHDYSPMAPGDTFGR